MNVFDFSGLKVLPTPAGKDNPSSLGGDVGSDHTATKSRISNQLVSPGQDSKVSLTQNKAKSTRQR